MNTNLELLAPAGNMECLDTALYFGADAVYLSGKAYGLRAFADNFSIEDLTEACDKAQRWRKKIYLTSNAVFHEDDFTGFDDYLRQAESAGIDALIVSDPGVVMAAKETVPDMPIHLSTQASTTNAMSVKFWQKIGISRVIVAREASLSDIRRMKDAVPEMELEAFIHGAMCISYSGRCLFSDFTTGRSGNKGECAQPCRWKYYVQEEKDGSLFPVYGDEKGTYLFNSKDLMMIEHMDKLMNAGVTSFKIEGRMKSAYYVGSVVKLYRAEIDKILRDQQDYRFKAEVLDEMAKCGTREYTTGFFLGNPMADGQDTQRTSEIKPAVFIAKVLQDAADGSVLIEQRNKFVLGDELEVLSPDAETAVFKVKSIVNEDGEAQESAPHPKQVLTINCPYLMKAGDLLRRNQSICD